jgi:hypothetical protein
VSVRTDKSGLGDRAGQWLNVLFGANTLDFRLSGSDPAQYFDKPLTRGAQFRLRNPSLGEKQVGQLAHFKIQSVSFAAQRLDGRLRGLQSAQLVGLESGLARAGLESIHQRTHVITSPFPRAVISGRRQEYLFHLPFQ